MPSCGHSGKCRAASKETSAVKTPAAATLKCQGVAGIERKPYLRTLKKQPHAELRDSWVYYRCLTLPLGVGGCRKAGDSPAAGQDFSMSLFARGRARNKEMKSISDRKKTPKKKHKKHHVKRGRTLLTRQLHDIAHMPVFKPGNPTNRRKEREEDAPEPDCFVPGVRGAEGPFSPVVSTMLPSV